MGVPSMYLPIKYALTYPNRVESGDLSLSLIGKTLHFFEADVETFDCLRLAKEASRAGGLYPTVLNGANEQAVALFLEGKIQFLQIARLVEEALSRTPSGNAEILDQVLAADREARRQVYSSYEKGNF